MLLTDLMSAAAAWLEGQPLIDAASLCRLLARLGFLAAKDVAAALTDPHGWAKSDPLKLARAVTAYQRWHGLAETGAPTPEMVNSLKAVRICKHPDVMNLAELAEWPKKALTWYLDPAAAFAQLGRQDVLDAFNWAYGQWCQVSGLQISYSSNPKTADIYVTTGSIDGPWGILAWSELPDGSLNQRQQKFDNQEAWCYSQAPTRFQIDLGRVAVHEGGHALGLPHLNAGAIMQPTYDPNIRTPQAQDIQEIQARYGPPVAVQPPAPAPAPVPPAPAPVPPPPGPASHFQVVLDLQAGGDLQATGVRVVRQ